MICTYIPFIEPRFRFTIYSKVPIGVKFYLIQNGKRHLRWFKKEFNYLQRVDEAGKMYEFGSLNALGAMVKVEIIP